MGPTVSVWSGLLTFSWSLPSPSGSGHGAADREEANCHMPCDQDPCRSLNELHQDREGAFGSGLCIRALPTLHLGKQDHHLHQSCGPKILALQEGREAMTDTMGVASS